MRVQKLFTFYLLLFTFPIMFDLDRWQEIWVTITRNKLRSILTCFGVFWGIFMLIILLGAGIGLQQGIMQGSEGFATNSCFFYTENTSVPYKGFRKGRSWNMKNRDLPVIKERVPGIEHISPMIWGNRSNNNIAKNEKAGTFGVRGVYPDFFQIETQRILYGRLFNDIDIQQKRKVCLIGTQVYDVLFKNGEDPVGQYIRVNGIYFQVVGVIKPIPRASIGGRTDESVMLPFTTMQRAYNYPEDIHFLCITVKKGFDSGDVSNRIKNVLKSQNDIAPEDEQAVGSFDISKQFKMFDLLFLGIGILIWGVGVCTLLAGVIGVSNIMLVTVRERTREIGVRRALGAKPWNIISQIMGESLLLTALAGLIGLVFGVFILDMVSSGMASQSSEDTFFAAPQVSLGIALSALGILLVCGLIAGLIPAWRAMKIKAIDAIRDE